MSCGIRRAALAVVVLFLLLVPRECLSRERRPAGPVRVVLVHGFLGWGRDEAAGYRYWGGFHDVEKMLRAAECVAHTASVGPISSNHDRACELFYQIVGGRTDYGAEHAARFGHDRYGRTWPGFHPAWSEDEPIHLVGHSMGGQTSRLLVELLERDFFGVGSTGRWVRSVTTIATPHDGTTLASSITELSGGRAEEFVGRLLALAGGDVPLYDFDLVQWRLERQRGEDISAFLTRLGDALGSTTDISSYDLSPEGARAMNEAIGVHPDVFHFSYSVVCTNPSGDEGRHRARWDTLPALRPLALAMGSYTGPAVDDHPVWWPNDGVVNTVSQRGPSTARIVEGAEAPLKAGRWYHVRCLEGQDHLQCIGHRLIPLRNLGGLKSLWAEIVSRLSSLPRPQRRGR